MAELLVRKLLITGFPKSGTGHMAWLCRQWGVRVEHERDGLDGISSWPLAALSEEVPNLAAHRGKANYLKPQPGRLRYRFDRVIHVVRDPLATIASAVKNIVRHRLSHNTLGFMEKHVTVDRKAHPLLQTTQLYVGWQRLLLQQSCDKRIDVADGILMLPKVLLGWRFVMPKQIREAKLGKVYLNASSHPDLQAAQLKRAVGEKLWRQFVAVAAQLGYPMDEVE